MKLQQCQKALKYRIPERIVSEPYLFLSTKNTSYKVCCVPEVTTTRKLIFFFTKTDRRKKFEVYISTYNRPLH